MSPADTKEGFTGIRGVLWPIYSTELKKFLPMGFMMLCILFNYTILRDIKDVLVVLAPAGGAETISFIKLYGVTPAAILFMLIFVKMVNVFSKENLFYALVSPFLIFFAAFAFVIFPNKEALHMSMETIKSIQEAYPTFHWMIPVIGNWSFSLFYILSELWGSVILAMLFWQFANQITKVDEAKRFYGLFGIIGNCGLMLAGALIYFCSKLADSVEGVSKTEQWGFNIKIQIGMVVFSGLITMGIYYWMHRSLFTDTRYYKEGQDVGDEKSKPKLPLKESFKYIVHSSYLGLIAIIVLAYGISINLVEGIWKSQIKIQFPNENDYAAFMGQFSFATGLTTVILMILGNNILRRLSWFAAAIITPLMLLVTSIMFFGFIIYENVYNPFTGLSTPIMTTTIVIWAVIIGMVQNVLSKATKYSLFDATKQMAYIPLDQELKTKGQAAVEVIGGLSGKSGGAAIQSMLLMGVGGGATLASLAPIFGAFMLIIVVAWCFSVLALSKRFEALTKQEAP
ncbi:MAG: Npt1/Npt2 family nucleotide transporter [Alphaproteobacteria bacterium]